MNNSECAAFVLMDYWTFEGFIRLRTFLKENPDVVLRKAIFPGIELRCEAPADFRMNIHLVCDDSLSDQQLRDLVSAFRLPLVERCLSEDALAEIVTKLSDDKLRSIGHTPIDRRNPDRCLEIGYKTGLISRDSFFDATKTMSEGTVFIFLPFDTYHGLRQINWQEHPLLTTEFMTRAHMFEARNSAAIDAFRGVRTAHNAAFFEHFQLSIGGKAKPAVSGSDAHSFADYGAFPVGDHGPRKTWIKANPTFSGLKQLFNEPASRTFVGAEPEKIRLVRDHPTKYIDAIEIRKLPHSELGEHWFDTKLSFNHDLVAIIGNRGTGKSALADILGLLGRSRNQSHFSFLNPQKFRSPRENKAAHFKATLTWRDGTESTCRSLDDQSSTTEVERIRYLPQNYLERVCDEIRLQAGSNFDAELKAVIFAHLPPADRLDKPSLDELVDFRTREINQAIEFLKTQLKQINAEMVEVEQRMLPEHKAQLESLQNVKQSELGAHDLTRPAEIPAPTVDAGTEARNQAANDAIASLRTELQELESQLTRQRSRQKAVAKLLAHVTSLEGQLNNFERVFEDLTEETSDALAELDIKWSEIVTFQIDRTPLENKLADLIAEETTLKQQLDAGVTGSLSEVRVAKLASVVAFQEQLDGPARLQQVYLTELAAWQEARNAIVGDRTSPGTIEFLNRQIEELSELPAALELLRTAREEKAREIHAKIAELADIFRFVYKPVQEFSDQHRLIQSQLKLNFSVAIVPIAGISESFFSIVGQKAAGSFCGAEEGERLLKAIVDRADFETADGAVAFANEIVNHLTSDRREGKDKPSSIARQLRKQRTVAELYDFVFSFEYLTPEFNLKLGAKSLPQLSHGERGMLLLMFYLLIDREDIPLVIDQPEGNLDNETVYKLLGECIKEAKKRRQIVIVTHNPNLAVACDAEQIICASIDQQGGNKVTYLSGAIEDPEINRNLIDILEGTWPAFQNRDGKYFERQL